MGIGSRIGKSLGPHVGRVAPGMTTAFVHEALERAINGVGPLPGAAAAADKQLQEQHGDVERAVHEIVENHVRWAGLQGFATNLGGLVTLAVTVPANITGLALLQCRMVAGIAHLRGYDLADPRVHNAILAAILGEETVLRLIKNKQLPGTPMAIATAPVHDSDLDTVMAAQVATAMITRVAGKRIAIVAGKRVPVVGGAIGAGTDAYSTWKVGRYVTREFLPRRR
ncbi:MAG: EcsC family protein [Actinomycetota bacterium]|nr:EcsC family protein [Actinomycetota bacterium]